MSKSNTVNLIIALGALNAFLFAARLRAAESLALVLWTGAVASYLAMNFTGSTPFTSPSGVEKEMRRAIPVLAAGGVLAAVVWMAAPFIG